MSDADLAVHLARAAVSGPRVVRVPATPGTPGPPVADRLIDAGAAPVVTVRALDWRTDSPGWLSAALAARLSVRGTAPAALASGFDALPPGAALVVERAELADERSLRALGEACALATDARVLVALVADTSAGTGSARIVAEIASAEVVPSPLRLDEIGALLGARTGRPAPAGLASRILELSDGDPGVVSALVAEVERSGVGGLGVAGPGDSSRPPDAVPVPRADRIRVSSLVGGLPGATVTLVVRLAVLGPEASWSLLARFAGVGDDDELTRLLAPACTSGLITVEHSPGGARIRFSRRLDHAAVLDGVDPVTLRTLRGEAARLLDPLDPDAALDQLAVSATGPDDGLARRLDARGSEHAAHGDWAAAAHAALTAAALTSDGETANSRHLRGVEALVEAGHVREAEDAARRLVGPAAEAGEATLDRRASAVLGHLATHRGVRSEADAHLSRADDVAGSHRVLHALASWLPHDLVDATSSSVSSPDLPAHVRAGAAPIGALGHAILTGKAVSAAPPGGTLAQDGGPGVTSSRDTAQRWALAAGWSALAADDPATARRHLEVASVATDRAGSDRIALWAQAWLARAHLLLGTWDDALRIVDTATRRVDDLGLDLLGPLVHWTGAAIRSMRDDPVGVGRHLVHLRPPDDSFPVQQIPSAVAMMQVAASRGDYGAVRRAGRPLVDLAARIDIDQPGWWPWAEHYCLALVQAGRLPEAESVVDPLWDRAEAAGHRSTLATIETVRARIAGLRGDHTRSAQLIASAEGRADELGIPYLSARLHFSHGRALRRSGRRREADAALRQAEELFAQMGASVYVRRCERERRAGGVDVERGARQDLTPQEKAVAALVAAGNANAAVADELFLSVKTVEYHLTRIYAKLGVRGRAELAAVYAG